MKTTQEQKWLDMLTIELRLRDVSGPGIGDTLATVREFLADSGESAQEAFGSPAEYAASLDLSTRTEPISVKGTVFRSVIGLLAFLVFSQAVAPWVAREPLDLGGAQLAWLAFPAVAAAFIPLYLDKLVRHLWVAFALIVVCGATGVLSALSAPKEHANAWLSINPGLVLVVTGAIMVSASTLSTISFAKDGDDSIREPFSDPTKERKQKATSSILGILVSWMLPIAALVFLGVGFLMR